MKNLIIFMFVLIGFSSCGDNDIVKPGLATANMNVVSTDFLGLEPNNYENVNSCTLSGSFDAVLLTRSGGSVGTIQPNTDYTIRISGPTGINPAYCMRVSSGFTEISECNDTWTSTGICDLWVTTASVLPSTVFAEIGPTCSTLSIPNQHLQLFLF